VELSAQAVKPEAGHARGKLLARLARVARKVQHELRSWITERRSRRQ
jgi:hypothetical protein